MKGLWSGAAVALVLSGAVADDPPKKTNVAKQERNDATPMARYKAARKAFEETSAHYFKVFSEIRKRGERPDLKKHKDFAEASAAYNRTADAVMAAVLAAARSDPKSADGFAALEAAVQFGMSRADFVNSLPEVVRLLTEYHVENPKVGNLCSLLPSHDEAALKITEPFLRAVMERNPDHAAKGKASIALGLALLTTRKAEAEKLLEEVATKYTDVKSYRGTLAKEAEANLFELRQLQVGMVAPDIEGEDVEGKRFKLSDYRGKVVMLDFWGHW